MDIPAQYNSKEVEDKIYKFWLDNNSFLAKVDDRNKPFTIVIPPPNVTGILHMGHALNNTIQDVLIRRKRMLGFQALWMPGTDHAGIATQNVVERKLAKEGLRKETIGREKFLEHLWDWNKQYGSTILEQLKKLGASCDWSRTRFTMDEQYSQAVKEVFIKLYNEDLIYRGNYIINWCPRCKTALSDEEAAHKELDGWLYYLKYPVVKNKTTKKEYVIVATTRPETMLGDTALAINPNDERYKWLKDCQVTLPIVNRKLTIIEDENIDINFGTGVVKVTPAHDPADFAMGKKHNLEFINIMDDQAKMNDNALEFSGMDRFEAREAIVTVLGEKGLIEKREPYKVNAGHCYRCHTIIEPRISLQWFVRMKPLAKEAIKVVEEDKIKFSPQRWEKVYLNWMNNIQDWCISRQIWWGHRLPVYYCKDCYDLEAAKRDNNYKLGIIVAKDKPTQCPLCKGSNIIQDEDVLDTWFSSWLWPFATLYWPKESKDLDYFYPTDVLVTASEILFFWVARMIMAGLHFKGEIPFKDVYIHGTVRDSKGVKMSKSLGNTIDPLEVISKFGADSLRFSLMLLAASGSDIYLSDDKFLVGRNFANKIWNASRFFLTKLKDNNLEITNLEFTKLDGIDMWLLEELNNMLKLADTHFENFSLNEATKKIYDFFWHVFCDWYIEIVKDNFTLDRAKVMLYVFISVLKTLHPVMPFITEELFQIIKQSTKLLLEKSITIANWPKEYPDTFDYEQIKDIQILIKSVEEIRAIKLDLGLVGKKIGLEVKTGNKEAKLWQDNKTWLQRLTTAKDIVIKPELKRILYSCQQWQLNLDIDEVDITGFIGSIEKKINQLAGVLKKVSERLRNERFLQSAAVETVEEEKNKFNELSNEIKRLEDLKQAFRGN